MRIRRCGIAIAGALLVTGMASAESIGIVNYDFEDQVLADGAWTLGDVSGWTVTGTAGAFNPTTAHFLLEAPSGSNTVFTNGGTISQVLDATLQADTEYVIGGLVGYRLELPLAEHAIELWAGDTMIASATGDPGMGEFIWTSATFDAVAADSPLVGEQLRIELRGMSVQANFDNITLDANPIPVPGALALLGIAGITSRRRRR